MDKRSPLHWSALLLGLFAAAWMLLPVVSALIFLLPVFAVAGFVLALVAAKRLGEQAAGFMRTGAAAGILGYGIWILLTLAAQPVSIKNVGNHEPPVFLSDVSVAIGPFLPIVGALAILATYWPLWRRMQQILAGIGAALIIVIPFIPTPTGTSALGTVLLLAYSLGWLALLLATLLPLLRPDDAHPTWTDGAPAP